MSDPGPYYLHYDHYTKECSLASERAHMDLDVPHQGDTGKPSKNGGVLHIHTILGKCATQSSMSHAWEWEFWGQKPVSPMKVEVSHICQLTELYTRTFYWVQIILY